MGAARSSGGHVVVLAGPDCQRYRHGVLGDAVEAARVVWLERHGLDMLLALELPAPHVFEDIAPRPMALPGRAPPGCRPFAPGPTVASRP